MSVEIDENKVSQLERRVHILTVDVKNIPEHKQNLLDIIPTNKVDPNRTVLNPLLHRLFLDHDLIFFF